jgi:peptidoglycan hydrolase-like protein with peptidoglycan-binding domain
MNHIKLIIFLALILLPFSIHHNALADILVPPGWKDPNALVPHLVTDPKNSPEATLAPTAAITTPAPTIASPVATPSQSPAIRVAGKFTKNMKNGSNGEDAKNLQIFLNSQGFHIRESGPGSPGNETIFFGPATESALIKFQEKYADEILTPIGLTKGTGFFGPITINKVNQLISNQ